MKRKGWDRQLELTELHDVLSRILPQYELISTAPPEPTNDPAEVARLYKSIDNNGNVYLIQNSAAWRYIDNHDGKRMCSRPKPIFKYNWEDAKKAAESGVER